MPLVGLLGVSAAQVVAGNVRIEALASNLIRIESMGPKGFEDRNTFNVVDRNWEGGTLDSSKGPNSTTVTFGKYVVTIPSSAEVGHSLEGVSVATKSGKLLYKFGPKIPANPYLPSPGSMPAAFALPDAPRVVPGPNGATPNDQPNSGWDLDNQAPDVYLWLNDGTGYKGLRKDLLKLTGPVPLIPRYFFGLWNSRYHPYTEQEALDVIDKYHADGFPLDMFVVDTDWRVGASHGYTVNTTCFPDMSRFLSEAHAKGVHTMFNDHPEPQAESALDPVEMKYRYDNLTKVFGYGNDFWWYDRNWFVSFKEPTPGFMHEVWGMAVYHDTAERYNANLRPVLMSNVPGIDNGIKNSPPPIASHRYPIWWTGDTSAVWKYLQNGVHNAVDGGVDSLLPYMSEDLTGHVGVPTQELYARYMEYGALSPIERLHCTAGQTRYPWEFGDKNEEIVKEYTHLRYRLIPTLYSAAHQSYLDGTPIVRRLDLEWPQLKNVRNDEYLLGDDILVAPVVDSMAKHGAVPDSMWHTENGEQGLEATYWKNKDLEGEPVIRRRDKSMSFMQSDDKALDPKLPIENWSARWKGRFGPVSKSGTYKLTFTVDDGLRVWIGDKKVIEGWKPQAPTDYSASVTLSAGESVPIRVEYNQLGGGAELSASWQQPTEKEVTETKREVMLPPGEWIDLWTGHRTVGPQKVASKSELWHTPLWVRGGGIVVTAPDVKVNSAEQTPGVYTLDCYPALGVTADRTIYEDDGFSDGYLTGNSATVPLTMETHTGSTVVKIGAASGSYSVGKHAYTVRLHLPRTGKVRGVTVDGHDSGYRLTGPMKEFGNWQDQMPFKGFGQLPNSNEQLIELQLDASDQPHQISVDWR